MFGHRNFGRGEYESGCGRNIERVGSVGSGTASIEQYSAQHAEIHVGVGGEVPQENGKIGNLPGGFSFACEAEKEFRLGFHRDFRLEKIMNRLFDLCRGKILTFGSMLT